ncbi:MAG: transcriptional regulator [Bacteroidota bacterium]
MKKIITNLNKAFDNHTRLAIMSVLMVNDWVDFKQMKEVLGVSDGNLASHIKALEKVEYVEVRKQFVGRRPQTSYRATITGRKAFSEHLDALEQLLKSNKNPE